MQDPTTRTLGSLLADPDTVVQRHAMGILKRLRVAPSDDSPKLEDIRPPTVEPEECEYSSGYGCGNCPPCIRNSVR